MQVSKNPARPVLAILGGSKVLSKIHLVDMLIDRRKVDQIIVGGTLGPDFYFHEPKWLIDCTKLFLHP